MSGIGVAQRSAAAFAPAPIDAVLRPDDAVADLAVFPVSGATFQTLVMVDGARLTGAGRVDHLTALRRHEAGLAAERIRTIAAIAEDDTGHDEEFVGLEIAPALGTSQAVAALRLKQARHLVHVLPDTLDALSRGELTEAHVRHLVDQTWTRSPALARAVEAAVLSGAGELTPARFGRAVARAVIRCDPATAAQRHAAAAEGRRTGCHEVGDGMSLWWLLAPTAWCAAADRAVDAVVAETRHADDERTADQRRADAAAQIFTAVLADPHLRRRQGQCPAVSITVPLQTLLGGDEPADLPGHGPLHADDARLWAATADRWRVLVTGEDGRLLALSTKDYRPSAAIRRFVLGRDVYCVFPGCTARAERCDLDHAVPWPLGPTDPANLHPLCRRHHRAKTTKGWKVKRVDRTGVTVWTSPTGHPWTSRPPTLPIPPPNREAERSSSTAARAKGPAADPAVDLSTCDGADPPPF